MGRQRKYESEAARQAAFRQRTKTDYVQVERAAFDAMIARMERLHTAMYHARQAGNSLAGRCYTAGVEESIDRLIAAFEAGETA